MKNENLLKKTHNHRTQIMLQQLYAAVQCIALDGGPWSVKRQ